MFKQFVFALIALFSTSLFAVEIGTPINASTPITNRQPSSNGGIVSTQQKPIVLMNIKLTPEEGNNFIRAFKAKHSFNFKNANHTNDSLPAKVELGMNSVPVLDQGKHGTCVTFAVTAAFNALINRGDHISQLCNLELGQYLEPRSYIPNGWNGSFGRIVISNFLTYGYIKKEDQLKKSCAGIFEYPLKDKNATGKEMLLDDYRQMSKSAEKFGTFTLLTLAERFEWTEENGESKSETLLNEVKAELAKPNAQYNSRLTFGVFLMPQVCRYNGACGKFHKENDTWVITDAIIKEINENPFSLAGHEMVITGYDDDAIALDNEGKTHKGLLTLRNSWSSEAGDQGNFYISYEYFRYLTMDVDGITYVFKRS